MQNVLSLDAGLYQEKYEVCKEVGKGTFGVVFQVKGKEDGEYYAAKHIRIIKQSLKKKVMEEIDLLQNLTHPQIVEFIGAYDKAREIILVTEYLNGGELFERIVSDDFNLTESDSGEFMRQILEGVQYLHKNHIVHLDLKPENILCINKDGMEIKIIDFGLARKVYPDDEIKVLCGTPDYVAPEIVSYDHISTATDMWALGVICYILLSGKAPFAGDNDCETYNNITAGYFDFDEPEFGKISQNAKDFISGLLQKQMKNRLRAEQCLDHPWLIQQQSRSVINTDNLKKFLNKRRWKKAFNVGLAVGKLSKLVPIKLNGDQNESLESKFNRTIVDEYETEVNIFEIYDNIVSNFVEEKEVKTIEAYLENKLDLANNNSPEVKDTDSPEVKETDSPEVIVTKVIITDSSEHIITDLPDVITADLPEPIITGSPEVILTVSPEAIKTDSPTTIITGSPIASVISNNNCEEGYVSDFSNHNKEDDICNEKENHEYSQEKLVTLVSPPSPTKLIIASKSKFPDHLPEDDKMGHVNDGFVVDKEGTLEETLKNPSLPNNHLQEESEKERINVGVGQVVVVISSPNIAKDKTSVLHESVLKQQSTWEKLMGCFCFFRRSSKLRSYHLGNSTDFPNSNIILVKYKNIS